MSSLKERMAAFQSASNDEGVDFKKKSNSPVPNKSSPGKLKSPYKESDTASASKKSDTKKRSSKLKKKSSPGDDGEPTTPSKKKTPASKKVTPSPSSERKKTKKNFAVKKISTEQSAARSKSPMRVSPKNSTTAAPPPPKALSLLGQKNVIKHDVKAHVDSAVGMMKDKSKAKEVEDLIHKIQAADGFPQIRRLSVRDNDLVQTMTKVIGNDPSINKMEVDSDVRFDHLAKSFVVEFGESIRSNLHLKKLVIRGVELGNDFLSALSTSMESNFVLTHIDLSRNHLTHDGMVEFCQAMEHNDSCTEVHLQTQHSPIYEKAKDVVLEALKENKTLTAFEVDFKSKEGSEKLAGILKRNQDNPPTSVDPDEKLLRFFKNEAERAQELWEQRKAEEEMTQVKDDDWGYLYELACLFDKYRLQEEVEDVDDKKKPERSFSSPMKKVTRGAPGRAKSAPLEGMVGYTADGKFLNEEFISKYLKEIPEKETLIFDFCGQFKLFKRFPSTDPCRHTIVTKFVDALLSHPRSNELTGINMANSCCGNDFFIILADRCLADDSLLPNVHLINAETNYITEPGVVALSKCISSPTALKYLQVVRLENQKALMTSKAELALAKAMCVNRSVVRMSLRVRNLLERQQINKYVVRNVDFLRQARRRHAIETGTLQERKRTEMEQFFDKIAADDPSITEVNLVGNQRFLSLNEEEKLKAGAAFANNTHIKTVMMSTLQLDDKFAEALAKALETNSSIEKLLLDSNAIAGDGMKTLFSGLAKNSSIVEMQVQHQSKVTNSSDEELLPDILEPSKTITKLGIDLRNQLAKMKIDRKLNMNREVQRKLRAQVKKAPAS
jgi:hypothetical protein